MDKLVRMIPLISTLVSLAEFIFKKKEKSGLDKKQFVKDTISDVWDAIDKADIMPEKAEDIINAVIDNTVKAKNKVGF